MKKIIEKIKKHKKILIIFTVFLLLTIFIFLPFIPVHYYWGMDTFYHYSNIFALLKTINVSSLFLPSKIYPIIAYDFGWASGIFYPSFPHYVVAYLYKIVSLIGANNILTSMKIVHFIVMFLSGISMYFLANKLFKNKISGLISGVIYMTFPYHYLDIFSRDAFAECFMFATVPLVFLGLLYLFDKNYKKFYIYFILGYVLCMNSHLVLSVYMTIFAVIFLLLNIKKILNKNSILSLIFASCIILLLTAPFILPLLQHNIFSDYTVNIKGLMNNKDVINETIVHFKDYFSLEKPLAWFGIVIPTISFAGLFAFILIFKDFKNLKKVNGLISFIILTIIVVLVMSPIFPWDKVPDFLLMIQFVWRLNLFLALFMSVTTGYIALAFKKKWVRNIIIVIVLSLAIYQNYTYRKMLIIEDFDVTEFDINKMGVSAYQYIPEKSYKNLDYVKNRGNEIIIKNSKDETTITNVLSDTPYLSFDIKTKGCTLELPRYYYLGYKITLDGKKIAYKENSKGFIEISVKNSGKVEMKYTGGIVYYISVALFGVGTIISFVYLYRTRKKEK